MVIRHFPLKLKLILLAHLPLPLREARLLVAPPLKQLHVLPTPNGCRTCLTQGQTASRGLKERLLGSFQDSISWSRIRCRALKTLSRCSWASFALSRRRRSAAVGTDSADGVENLDNCSLLELL